MTMLRRLRVLALLASFLFLALVAPAFAQEAGEAPGLPTGMALAILIGGLILGFALSALTVIAPLTRNTYDDAALKFLRDAEPTIRKWLDPKDPTVPPSPTNPSGTA